MKFEDEEQERASKADRSVLAVRDCLMVRLDAVIRLYTRLLPQLN